MGKCMGEDMKVRKKCLLVLLVKGWWTEGKALGSKEE
jgi:hypothetical protein